MKRAKRKQKVEVKTTKINEYWTVSTNELFKKIGIPTDSNDAGTCPSVDPTLPLLFHIMQCVGSLGEVRRKYKSLGDDFKTNTTPVCDAFSIGLDEAVKNLTADALRFPINSSDDKPIAVSFLTASRAALESVPNMTAAQEVQTPSMSADTISDMKLREAPPTTGAARGLMLHELALRMSSDPTVALEGFKMVAKANVEAAKIPDMNGRLPLHNAAMNENIRMDVIERLLQMYPESPLVADHAGWLPLHHAVACERVNVTLVTKLCEVAPPAVLKMCNDKQWTPLDLLLVRHVGRVAARARRGHDRTDREELVQRTMEVCQILLRTNNKCCRATDLKGRFPLHLVLETYHLDLPLFRLLVNEYPHAVSHRAKAAEGCEVGELPLHIALRHLRVPGVTHRFTMISSKVEHPPVEQTRLNEAIETESYRDALSAVGDLIRLAPTTAQECASDGSLPLHQAIFYGLGGTDFPSRRLTSLMHYQHPPPRLEPTVETTPESESDDEDEDKKDTRERGSALLLAERRKKAEEEALLHDEALLEGSIREYYRKHAPDKTREDVLAAVAQFKEILGKDHEDESRQLVEKKFLALTLYISIAKMCDQVEELVRITGNKRLPSSKFESFYQQLCDEKARADAIMQTVLGFLDHLERKHQKRISEELEQERERESKKKTKQMRGLLKSTTKEEVLGAVGASPPEMNHATPKTPPELERRRTFVTEMKAGLEVVKTSLESPAVRSRLQDIAHRRKNAKQRNSNKEAALSEEGDTSMLFDAPPEFIKAVEDLIFAYPSACETANKSGLLPLHVLCSCRLIDVRIVREIVRRYTHAVQEPIFDLQPMLTTADCRLLKCITISKKGVRNLPWPITWHGDWTSCQFTPLSRAYDRECRPLIQAMRKAAIGKLGGILKESIDKIVQSETGEIKVAAPMPSAKTFLPRIRQPESSDESGGSDSESEVEVSMEMLTFPAEKHRDILTGAQEAAEEDDIWG